MTLSLHCFTLNCLLGSRADWYDMLIDKWNQRVSPYSQTSQWWPHCLSSISTWKWGEKGVYHKICRYFICITLRQKLQTRLKSNPCTNQVADWKEAWRSRIQHFEYIAKEISDLSDWPNPCRQIWTPLHQTPALQHQSTLALHHFLCSDTLDVVLGRDELSCFQNNAEFWRSHYELHMRSLYDWFLLTRKVCLLVQPQ